MENFGIHLEPLRAILYQIGAFIPRLLVALVVVLVGWLVAKAARFAVTKALRAINFNVLTERAGLDNFLRQGGLAGDTSSLFGVLAYWLVILASLLIAFNGMGLCYIGGDNSEREFLSWPKQVNPPKVYKRLRRELKG